MVGSSDRTVSTGRIAVGRVVLDVGAPDGAIVRKVRARGAQPPPELVQALAAPAPERRPLDVAEQAIETADEVAADVEHAATLFEKLASGQVDLALITGELERLFALLTRLDAAGRYAEVLRLARVLARLLTVATKWVALVQTLRLAAHAARELADSDALAWVLHELGTLAFGADDAQAAERDLEEACRRREQQGDGAALQATRHNLRAVRRGPPSMLLHAGLPAIVLGIVLALVIAGSTGDDDDPTTTIAQTDTETSPPPPPPPPAGGDTTDPRVTLALGRGTREVTNDPTPAFSGEAGTADGDDPTVTIKLYAGEQATGEPVEVTARRRADGRYTVTAPALASGAYTARAEQRDEAGNLGRSGTVRFTVDLAPPEVQIVEPKDGTETDESPDLRGTAGRAEGDGETVTLTFSRGPAPVTVTVAADGTWSYTAAIEAMLDETEQNFLPVTVTATQTDAAGNSAGDDVRFTPDDTPD